MKKQYCEALKKQEIKDTNFDGEPRKMAIFPDDCKRCYELNDCILKIKTAYQFDEVSNILKQP